MSAGKRLRTTLRRSARLAVALLLAAGAARAQAQSGKGDFVGSWSASAALGYAVPDTDEYENVPLWRLSAAYSPVPQLEFALEAGRFDSRVDQPDPDGLPLHTIASGALDVRPICLTAGYRTPLPESLATLTLLGGVGFYFVECEMAGRPRRALEGLPDQSVDDAWGFHVGAGLEYPLAERLSLVADGRYVFLEPRARGTAASGRRFDGFLDLNTWVFTGGVRIAF